ncbi:MAG: S41 family peptidase [Bacteroidaceae bacterium]|nr:S41 family peptidase [Bacteroidaceae bacterium]
MKRKYVIAAAMAACVAVSGQRGIEEQLQKLLIAESAISQLYVEPVSDSVLVESAVKGMLEKLDPHSTYLTPKEVQDSNESLNGNFDGIGIQFNMVQDTLYVVQPVVDGPSEKVGIIAGDRIVTVNDTSIAGVKMKEDAIKSRLRGPKGTHVKLGILRHGIEELIYFDVVRDKIPLNTIDAHYMIGSDIGYVKIASFGATTLQEFKDALAELKAKGMKSLIVDLQDNGGGYLTAATGMANEFLQRDQLIVYTEGRSAGRSGFKASGDGGFKEGKVVVLIDEYSASASEILSGALQDWDRAAIVGRRSFGKGLVQRPVDFPDGSVIRLTVAKYFTPSGRCIQKPYGDDVKYSDDIVERLHRGELMNQDSIHFADSLKYKTLVEGRTVYGGGGIMPDYFVPLDTTQITPYYRLLSARGVILQSSIAYVDAHRKQLERKFKTFRDYDEKFTIDKEYLDIVRKKADALKIEFKEDEYEECLPLLEMQLKALVARNLWTINEYYSIIGRRDPILKKGIEVITQ